MLVAGLTKLFVLGADKFTSVLSEIGFPIAWFFAWVLILSEIVFGIAIMAKWKLKYVVWPPIAILLIAALTVYTLRDKGPQWGQIGIHLALASNLWLISANEKAK